MPNKLKILAIIPARGGSKRIPRKNIKKFLGKPLLAWSIEVAKKSRVLDRIIVSTEDAEIAAVAKKYGAEVPFMRPVTLAQDKTPTADVLLHALQWLYENENYSADWIILLEPPSPGRQPFHIREVVKLIKHEGHKFDSIVGISELPGHFNPLKVLTLGKRNMVTLYGKGEISANLAIRNQNLPKSYFVNSAIYAFRAQNILDPKKTLWGDKVRGYVMDLKYALDIDTPEEWIIAEARMKKLRSSAR
jgi:N-acylneuraminate cytidylyltransferase/CMP-N,N'-diacetyllegionaminic acid synthase